MNCNLEMMKILDDLKNKNEVKRLLLHSCCGPCSSYVISLLSDYFDIDVIYYNPNIEPELEYLKRKENQIKFIKNYKSKNKINFIECDYNNKDYRNYVEGFESCKEGGQRCYLCIELRLLFTTKFAKNNNYDYFASTLSVSPHKNSLWINEIGNKLSKEYSINYLINDFKKNDGYLKSIKLSKEYDLYRQNYCGCLFSKSYLEKKDNQIK